jgi:beta-glucosidase-like glycosyl hydrolase
MGQPTCASDTLRHILRDIWNFTGYQTSDTGALEDVYKEHKYVATEQEAACVSLINGTTDVCSGAVYHDAVLGCGADAVNAALRRTFRLRFQLGLFDPVESSPYWSTPLSAVATPAARALNALSARESMVLLKHSAGAPGALPWAPVKRTRCWPSSVSCIWPMSSTTSGEKYACGLCTSYSNCWRTVSKLTKPPVPGALVMKAVPSAQTSAIACSNSERVI